MQHSRPSDVSAKMMETIPYHKELRPLAGTVTATILLQQMLFRAAQKEWEPFYKFRSPCQHPLYREGDSWIEELGFSEAEFDNALDRIGTKIKKGMNKSEALAGTTSNNLVIYWTDAERVTWYLFNRDLYDKLITELNLAKLTLAKLRKSIYLENRESQDSRKSKKVYFSFRSKKTSETTTETTNTPQAAGAAVNGGGQAQQPSVPEAVPVVPAPVPVPEATPATNGLQPTLYDLGLPSNAPLQKVHAALLGMTTKQEWFGAKSVKDSQIDASRIHMNGMGLTQALLNDLGEALARIYGWEALIEASDKAGVRSDEREVLYEQIPQLYAMGIDSVEKLEAAAEAWNAAHPRFGKPQGRQLLKYVSDLNARTKAGDTQGGKDAGAKTGRNGSKSTASPLEEWERVHGPASPQNTVADAIWKKWPKEERTRYFAKAVPAVNHYVRDVSDGDEGSAELTH